MNTPHICHSDMSTPRGARRAWRSSCNVSTLAHKHNRVAADARKTYSAPTVAFACLYGPCKQPPHDSSSLDVSMHWVSATARMSCLAVRQYGAHFERSKLRAHLVRLVVPLLHQASRPIPRAVPYHPLPLGKLALLSPGQARRGGFGGMVESLLVSARLMWPRQGD